MSKNDDQPATKKDLERDMSMLEARLEQKFDEVMNHFDVVAENIHQDVAGANKDEISLIKQKQTLLTKRVTVLEEKVGV